MTELPMPEPGQAAAEAFVATHLADLVSGPIAGSPSFRGGQIAADAALAGFDVTGYASRRNEVYPQDRRGASRLSPYIRHGLLSLPDVWASTAQGPSRDVDKFHDELLWQEFARHWYARLGPRTAHGVRRSLPTSRIQANPWDRSMACMDLTVGELESDGWLVNQTRMWLSSQWAIRHGLPWQDGEDEFFRHLLDGSRAANRLGWQWTTGVGSSKHYGFSRWQVNKRAPGLCDSCVHRAACPIEDWPDDPHFDSRDPHDAMPTADQDPTRVSGPRDPIRPGEAELVWLTAESLGHHDRALVAAPQLPVVFVFDAPLLRSLQLSAKRLIFLTETLAEIGQQRDLALLVGDPVELLRQQHVAVTFAPVPGFRRRADLIGPAEVYPWPWLVQPTSGSLASFSAWRRSVTSA